MVAKTRRRSIGLKIKAYNEGRRDAREGVRRSPRSGVECVHYLQGWKDEAARMRRLGRLSQLEIFPASE